jgi:sensor histidine kinase YesM
MKKMEFDGCCGCESCEPTYDEQNSSICTEEIPNERGEYPKIEDVKVCPKSSSLMKYSGNDLKTLKKLITFKEEHPQIFKLILCSSFVVLTGAFSLMEISIIFFSSPECTGISWIPVTFEQMVDDFKTGATILFILQIIGTISASISYYKASKTFKRSSELWQTAEDELHAMKEFEYKKDGCFVRLFWAWWLATYVFSICTCYLVVVIIRQHGIELLSASSLNSLFQVCVGYNILLLALTAFFFYLLIFTAQTSNHERFNETKERLKKRIFGTKGDDKDVL